MVANVTDTPVVETVSLKALPFCCASTAFLSKTVPFCAVQQQQDEQGFLCSPSSHQLPPVEFAALGKHNERCWGLDVAYGVVGFAPPRGGGAGAAGAGSGGGLSSTVVELAARGAGEQQQQRRRQRGAGGRNLLHACIQDGKKDAGSLLDQPELRRQLPQLLRQRDANGATPFFAAMQKGDLATAEAIRRKVEAIKAELGGKQTDTTSGSGGAGSDANDVLVTPDIFGTPPLHALVRYVVQDLAARTQLGTFAPLHVI
eukprot:SAG22_NODE_563_length_9067_cov_5.039251_1_plen_258_part_00